MKFVAKLVASSTACALVFAIAAVAQDFPKADLLFGYSGFRANPARNLPSFYSNGASAPFTWNFNRYVGFETEFAGYTNANIHNVQFDTTEMTYLFGPRFSFSRARTFVPYVHTLFGGVHLTTSLPVTVTPTPLPTPTPVTTTPTTITRLQASQDAFAMALGGGIDIRVSHLITLRPMQFDYLMTRLEDFGQSGQPSQNRNQHNVRYSAGIMFNFGGERASPPPPPPPPPTALRTKQCPGAGSVPIDQDCPKQNLGFGIVSSPSQICQGASVIVTPNGTLPAGAVSQWAINGERVSQAQRLEFGSTGRDPGVYRINLKVTAEGYNDASADTAVTVLAYVPPSGTLTVSPSEIFVGEKATLSASFTPGQCGGAVGPVTFSASEGSVSADQYIASGVQLAPPGTSEQRKTIAITAKVSDERGSGSAQASVVVKQPALLSARQLPDVLFAQDSDRVNNCGKRVLLEELHTLANNDPSGRVVFVGHIAEGERASKDLDLKRALNAAAVISAGQEVCTAFPASQIFVNTAGTADNGVRTQPNFCSGSTAVAERPGQTVDASDDLAKFRRVEVWFVPAGGAVPASGAGAKDAAALGVSKLGCPR